MITTESTAPVPVSIGLIARNEERGILRTLESLFRQTLFAELEQRDRAAEILCIANACTDATPELAARLFAAQSALHPHRHGFTARTLLVPEAGKLNAWNLFVHQFSAREARYLILMDADILFGHVTTLWNLCRILEEDSHAQVATGEPIKDLALKADPTLRERLSLATSRLTQGTTAQLTGQLYCIRAATARRIHLPRDLAACEDGFIKGLVCTDFMTKESNPGRIVRARDASHIYTAYVTVGDILRNQKRQVIGQTFVHVLLDRVLPALSPDDRIDLRRSLEILDQKHPSWLRLLMAVHLRHTRYFWRLFPGILTFRFRRLAGLPWRRRIFHLPAALAGFAVTLTASCLAARALRRGQLAYWPGKGPVRAGGTGDPVDWAGPCHGTDPLAAP